MAMTRAAVVGAVAILLVLLAPAACRRAPVLGDQDVDSAATAPSTAAAHEGLLYGRVTTYDDAIYEGRLRWGGDEEALWGNYFNGVKDENPWAAYAPPEPQSIEVFGIEISGWNRQRALGRPFMARFGDVARIEPRPRDIRVVLKSGTEFVLDRFSADDLADGLRVWDGTRGVVDLGEWVIRSVELLPSPGSGPGAYPLHGTVRTRQGSFTGLVQWDRQQCVGLDELDGLTADGELRIPFDTVRSIARRSGDSSLVTRLDGGEIVLSSARDVGSGNRGIYVDDQRYGRVLISWDAFERVDFGPGGTGPAYGDFPAGRPLTGSVTIRSGRRLAGRLVYDLDESETTETLDAPSQGVNYTIPFGLIASIVPRGAEGRGQRVSVTLHSGEELQLEPAGDLGDENAGMLVFVDGRQRPEYVAWLDVEQVDFESPPEMYPPNGLAGSQAVAPVALSGALRAYVKDGRFDIVTSIRGLPLGVRDALQTMFGSRTLDIAEPGAEFQITDVAANPRLPSRRLVAAGCTNEYCLVYYERGGVAHTWHVALFHWTPAATRFEWGGTAPGGLATINDVRNAVLSGVIKAPATFW